MSSPRARHRSTGRLAGLAVLAVVTVGGCSLPLPPGVHAVGQVAATEQPRGPLQVIPPGPQAGASPRDLVLGFLGAQADPDGAHAIARRFLSPAFGTAWRDDAGVLVYDPDRLVAVAQPSAAPDRAVVQVTYAVTAQIGSDGSFTVRAGERVSEAYDLQQQGGRWVITSAPQGLRLTPADRERSFVPEPVYYLAPVLAGQSPHLVADQVFVPSAADLATSVVGRLLGGPSQGIAGSVTTAVPTGWHLLAPVRVSGSGQATVEVAGPPPPTGTAAQNLAAQLGWTLKSLGKAVRSVLLRVDGHALQVNGSSGPQDVEAWDSYDPDPLAANPPYYFVARRSPQVSVENAGGRTRGGAFGGVSFPVDGLAVTPDQSRAALLQDDPDGQVELHVGSLEGPFPTVYRAAGLTSPSWGSAELGLWLVRDHQDLLLAPGGTGAPRTVPIRGRPAGELSDVAVSRDDARVALVIGGQLYLARIVLQAGQPVVSGLVAVVPGLHAATAVAWTAENEVVVIGARSQSAQVLRVAVDGSAVTAVNTAGLAPTSVTGTPLALIVGSGGRLYQSTAGPFRQVQGDGSSAPAYPG